MSDRPWFLNAAEGPVGPYAAADLRAMCEAGQITDDWYVWREGQSEWMRLGDVAELKAAPAPAPVPPAPSAAAKGAQPGAAQAGGPLSGANVLAKAVAAKGQAKAASPIVASPAGAAAPSAQPASAASANPAPAAVSEPAPAEAPDPEPIIIRAPSRGKQIASSLGRLLVILLVLAAVGGGVGYYLYGDELFVMLGIVEPPPPPPVVPTVSPEETAARRVYLDYQKAITDGDRDRLGELLTAERAALLQDTTVDLLADLRAARPETAATVASADVTPEQVTLKLNAPGPSGRLEGSAVIVREEGEWRVSEEAWKLPVPDTAALERALFETGLLGLGDAAVAKDSVPVPAIGPESESLRLVVGTVGATDFTDSRKAVLEFRSGIGRDARRLELSFDATKRGRQKIDGQQASLSFIASNAQVFSPDGEGSLEVVQPYSGAPDGVVRVVVRRLTLSSGGVSFPVSIAITCTGSLRPSVGAAAVAAADTVAAPAPAASDTTGRSTTP